MLTLVHEGGGSFVLKRLAFHYVTPVAGRIANAEEDRLPFLARSL
jgi:hypothetical protein